MKLLSLDKKRKENIFKNYIIENQKTFYKIAYTYVKNNDDALDIVQEAICKGLSKIKTIKDINLIKPWFYKILINTSIDYIRKNKKYTQERGEVSADNIIDRNIDIEIDIERALDSLCEEDKTLVILRYFEDMKISDIATILDKNENTIKTRLYKTLKLLKIEINKDIEGGSYEK